MSWLFFKTCAVDDLLEKRFLRVVDMIAGVILNGTWWSNAGWVDFQPKLKISWLGVCGR